MLYICGIKSFVKACKYEIFIGNCKICKVMHIPMHKTCVAAAYKHYWIDVNTTILDNHYNCCTYLQGNDYKASIRFLLDDYITTLKWQDTDSSHCSATLCDSLSYIFYNKEMVTKRHFTFCLMITLRHLNGKIRVESWFGYCKRWY